MGRELKENIDSNWEKVWENENPTSAFTDQKVLVDLSKYTIIAVKYRTSTAIARGMFALATINETSTMYSFGFNNGIVLRAREFIPYHDSVLFIGASKCNSSVQETDNTLCIPTAIYGVK